MIVQWNLSKQNLLRTNFCVQNRQVFDIYRLKKEIFLTLGLYLKFSLYRILVYSGFSIDRFYWTYLVHPCKSFFSQVEHVNKFFFFSILREGLTPNIYKGCGLASRVTITWMKWIMTKRKHGDPYMSALQNWDFSILCEGLTPNIYKGCGLASRATITWMK